MVDMNEELIKLREEISQFHTKREAEADNALLAMARWKYSGLAFLALIFLMFVSGWISGNLIHGTFFCV